MNIRRGQTSSQCISCKFHITSREQKRSKNWKASNTFLPSMESLTSRAKSRSSVKPFHTLTTSRLCSFQATTWSRSWRKRSREKSMSSTRRSSSTTSTSTLTLSRNRKQLNLINTEMSERMKWRSSDWDIQRDESPQWLNDRSTPPEQSRTHLSRCSKKRTTSTRDTGHPGKCSIQANRCPR